MLVSTPKLRLTRGEGVCPESGAAMQGRSSVTIAHTGNARLRLVAIEQWRLFMLGAPGEFTINLMRS